MVPWGHGDGVAGTDADVHREFFDAGCKIGPGSCQVVTWRERIRGCCRSAVGPE